MRAIILSRQDYREADQLITLFSYERGKETGIAKSVKKIVSKNSPFLEPGVIAEIDIVPAHEFPRLIRATPLFVGARWRADFFRLSVGAILLSILAGILPSATPEKPVFVSFESWLRYVDETADSEAVLTGATACVLAIVSALGFQPILDRCVGGHEFSERDDMFFDPAQGGFACAAHVATFQSQAVRISSLDARQLVALAASSWSQLGEIKLSTVVHHAVWSLASRAFDRPLPRWWTAGR